MLWNNKKTKGVRECKFFNKKHFSADNKLIPVRVKKKKQTTEVTFLT